MNTSFAGDEEDLSGSELIAMEGEAELMGFSIGKALRKTKQAVKKGAAVVGRNAGNIAVVATAVPTLGLSTLAKKNVRSAVGKAASKTGGIIKRNAGNIAVIATAIPTGGLSLLGKKSARNLVGKAARATQSAVLRPFGSAAMDVARSKIGKSLLSTGISAGASFIPGGSAALAATRKVQNLARSKTSARTAVAPKSVAVPTHKIKRAPRALMPSVISASPVESEVPMTSPFLSKPVLIGGGAALGLLVVVLAMNSGHNKSR